MTVKTRVVDFFNSLITRKRKGGLYIIVAVLLFTRRVDLGLAVLDSVISLCVSVITVVFVYFLTTGDKRRPLRIASKKQIQSRQLKCTKVDVITHPISLSCICEYKRQ